MKKIFRNILKYYLKFLTKLALLIYNPTIIVVAGSANKFFFKEELKKVLEKKGIKSRVNPQNYNTDIGLPLSILDLKSGYNSYKDWLPILKKSPWTIFKKMPEYLILSLGTSNKGDMKYLLTIIKPKIAVITEITQRHLEGFKNMDEMASEYKYLAQKIGNNGVFIYNIDNSRTRQIAKESNAKKISFGFSKNADWQATEITKINSGYITKIFDGKNFQTYEINRFGNHYIYSLLAGLIFKKYVS